MRPFLPLLSILLLPLAVATAQIPRTISYQGALTGNGQPVPDGDHIVTVSLYDMAAGGSVLYSESRSLRTTGGIFSLEIGSISGGIPSTLSFDNPMWLGVSVDGATELQPRTPLTSVPYALYAQAAAALSPDATGVVRSINGQSGTLTFVGEGGATVTQHGGTITIGAGGGGGAGGIQGVQNSDGALLIQNANGPSVTVNVMDGGITAAKLAPNAVTTDKIDAAGATAGAVLTYNGQAVVWGSAAGGGWGLEGNGGTSSGTHFIGTLDNQAFEVHVSNIAGLADDSLGAGRVMRWAPAPGSPILVGGYHGNTVPVGNGGNVILGGGIKGAVQQMTGSTTFSIIGGGAGNAMANSFASTIGGGILSYTSSYAATIGGGQANGSTAPFATIGGGAYNRASGANATIGGGLQNAADSSDCVVAGGIQNRAQGTRSIVLGGLQNTARGSYSIVGGGYADTAFGSFSTVAGGYANRADSAFGAVGGGFFNRTGPTAVVAGGTGNHAAGQYAAIGGGSFNSARGMNATIGGGGYDSSFAHYTTIAGGYVNRIDSNFGTIGGGLLNRAGLAATVAGGGGGYARGSYAAIGGGLGDSALSSYGTIGGGLLNVLGTNAIGGTIGGGSHNSVSAMGGAIGGGDSNRVAGILSTVPGGFRLTASGNYSTAMGSYATAATAGSFVYGDYSTTLPVASTTPNQFVVRAQHIWLGTNNAVSATPDRFLETSTGAYLSIGGSWTNSSDRNRKTEIQTIDRRKVLEGVAAMPMTEWRYRDDAREVRHIGPMAQDFHAAFGLNGPDSTHIATVDADGVALAAIGGLNEIVREQQQLIERLQQQNQRLEAQQTELLRRIERLETGQEN